MTIVGPFNGNSRALCEPVPQPGLPHESFPSFRWSFVDRASREAQEVALLHNRCAGDATYSQTATGVCKQPAVGLAFATDNVRRNATRSFLRHRIIRCKMKKNRIGTQVWPSVFSHFSSARVLSGSQRIAVRDRNIVIAFAESSK